MDSSLFVTIINPRKNLKTRIDNIWIFLHIASAWEGSWRFWNLPVIAKFLAKMHFRHLEELKNRVIGPLELQGCFNAQRKKSPKYGSWNLKNDIWEIGSYRSLEASTSWIFLSRSTVLPILSYELYINFSFLTTSGRKFGTCILNVRHQPFHSYFSWTIRQFYKLCFNSDHT